MNIISWIAARLKERNTWLGIVSLLATAGISFDPELQSSIITAGIAIAGVIAIVFKDDPKAE